MRGLSSASHGRHTDRRDPRRVKSWLKAFVVVVVTLPIAAYVVATLGASPAQPTPQSPVVLRDPPPNPALQTAPAVPGRAVRTTTGTSGAGDDDGGRDDDRTEGDDISVVTPSPKRVGDDDGTDDDGGSDDGDDTSRGGDT